MLLPPFGQGLIGRLTLFGKRVQRRTLMCRIGLGLDKTLIDKQVDLLQDAFPGDSHRRGDMRDVRRLRSHRNGTKHLPSCTGQAARLRKVIAPFDELAVQLENG